MDAKIFEVEAEIELDHWWFRGRRDLFSKQILGLNLPKDAAILDVGTSTGTNLRLLRDAGFTNVHALDSSTLAIDYVTRKGLGKVVEGDICAMPYDEGAFDLVLATDVIEHVDDDAGALREIYRVLRPSGRMIVTVPAFNSLWGNHDVVAHHKRRYRLNQLCERIKAAGFVIEQSHYFNYVLFPAIWLARRILNSVMGGTASENRINTPFINRVLTAIFRFDVKTAPVVKPPFGVSAYAIAQKPAG